MASVEYLIKQFLSPDKKDLDLSNQNLSDKGAIQLAESKQLKKLTKLRLPNNNIGDEGAIVIADSKIFKNMARSPLPIDLSMETTYLLGFWLRSGREK